MFDARASGEEFLDRPECDATLAAASYRFMERVNRHFGGIRVALRFLQDMRRLQPPGSRLHILDIGSGSCDIPLALSHWATRHGHPLRFTCLEPAPHALAIARNRLAEAQDLPIRLLQENAFAHSPQEPYDCAMASMCFHHLKDEDILALLRRLRSFVRRRILINDLRRSAPALLAARILAIGQPHGVRHDALLSIRRGFTVPGLRALLNELEGARIQVRREPCFRISAVIDFSPEAPS